MSLFGLFDSKKTDTTNTTQTTQTDNSKTVGEGGTLLEAGSSFNYEDLSADVAKAALDANYKTADVAIKESAGVAGSALTLSALTSGDAFKFATNVADKTVAAIEAQNRNTTLAAQDAVSYGRQLAQLGYSAQVEARQSETSDLVEKIGKYGVWALVLGVGGLGLFIWSQKKG